MRSLLALLLCSYEAWVIYNFLSLCLAYVGGPGAVEVKMNGYVLMPSWTYSTCCLPPLLVNGRFVRMCKRVSSDSACHTAQGMSARPGVTRLGASAAWF